MSDVTNNSRDALLDSHEATSPDIAMSNALERITNIIGVIGGIGILLLLIHVVLDVFGRIAFNSPVHGTLEISQYWYMPIIVFLGLAIAERTDQHISAPIVYDRVKPRLKIEFSAVSMILSVALLLGFAWYGLEEAMTLVKQGATGIVSQVPIWPTRFLVPLGSLLFAFEIIAKFIANVKSLRETRREEDTEWV